MSTACLDSRSVIRVSGADAASFLQNILTCDVDALSPGKAGFGALLTPQGKILFDFFLYRTSDQAFLFDIDAGQVESFIKRLGFYRLRANVVIENVPGSCVIAGWNDAPVPAYAAAAPDPRLAALGWRAIVARGAAATGASETAYHAHRIALGVPQSTLDYTLGETFPHDADMDQLNGVSFGKGCYIGQEVVSRMQHRSTARTRCVTATCAGPEAPAAGSPIMAGEKVIGTTGSVAGSTLIAMVRIDKVLDIIAAHMPVTAAGAELTLRKPGWAKFDFPQGE